MLKLFTYTKKNRRVDCIIKEKPVTLEENQSQMNKEVYKTKGSRIRDYNIERRYEKVVRWFEIRNWIMWKVCLMLCTRILNLFTGFWISLVVVCAIWYICNV